MREITLPLSTTTAWRWPSTQIALRPITIGVWPTIYPNVWRFYCDRAIAKGNKGDLEGAIHDCDEAVVLAPKEATGYNIRGVALEQTGHWDKAAADLARCIELRPQYARAYYERGLANEMGGDFSAAAKDYQAYVERDPRGATFARFDLALVLRRENADESPAGLPAAVAGWPAKWPKDIGLFVLGSLTESDLLERAKAGKDDHHLCDALYYAGMVRLLKGDTVERNRLLQRCVDMGRPDWDSCLLARAELSHGHGAVVGKGAAPSEAH